MSDLVQNLLKAVAARHGVLRLNEAGQLVYSGPRLATSLQWRLYELRDELTEEVARQPVDTADVKMVERGLDISPLKNLQPGDVVRLLDADGCLIEAVDIEPAGRAALRVVTRGQRYTVWLWKWSNLEVLARATPAISAAPVAGALDQG